MFRNYEFHSRMKYVCLIHVDISLSLSDLPTLRLGHSPADLLSSPASWASENTVLAFLLLPGLPRSPLNSEEKWKEEAGVRKKGCVGSGFGMKGLEGRVRWGR